MNKNKVTVFNGVGSFESSNKIKIQSDNKPETIEGNI